MSPKCCTELFFPLNGSSNETLFKQTSLDAEHFPHICARKSQCVTPNHGHVAARAPGFLCGCFDYSTSLLSEEELIKGGGGSFEMHRERHQLSC